MRTVVHLSDLHFGRVDRAILGPITEVIRSLRPDLIAVSGDLTQRARQWQFRDAWAFLESLPGVRIVVPGNHDVPLFNVLARFFDPLGGFRRHITTDLRPFYADEEIAVAGINTTRSLTIKGGALRKRDVERVCRALAPIHRPVVKIVVGHHPFGVSEDGVPPPDRLATSEAVAALAGCGTDVFLTGHLHLSYTGHTAGRYSIAGRSAIVVEAGTATSTRMRGEANAFNVLRIQGLEIVVERYQSETSGRTFEVVDVQHFRKIAEGWRPAE